MSHQRHSPEPWRLRTRHFRRVPLPVESRIAKWFDRHTSQSCCTWNVKFSRDATEEALTPRAELVAPHLSAFAAMDDGESKARSGDTPLGRAKLRGLERNVAAVCSNRGTGGQ